MYLNEGYILAVFMGGPRDGYSAILSESTTDWRVPILTEVRHLSFAELGDSDFIEEIAYPFGYGVALYRKKIIGGLDIDTKIRIFAFEGNE